MSRVKEVSQSQRANVYRNTRMNRVILEHYNTMTVAAVIKKRPWGEVNAIKSRMKRMENCNRFWQMETYEVSKVKRLLQTYLCRDKFCYNCKKVRQLILKKRFIPYMEQYRETLYHVTLTVPDCTGEKLGDILNRMSKSFKTLVNYLSGTKKISALDLMGYGYKGCIRSLEITYAGDVYHPHYHVAAVFNNPAIIEDKCINNKFSMSGKRLFSEFEVILQRMWWLLLNGQRLTYENITADSADFNRYSCIVDKFNPEDYGVLFEYVTKIRTKDSELMEYENFTTFYNTLNRVRQIQGCGIFYNVKAAENDPAYSEQEYRDIEDYIQSGEIPVETREPLSRLAKDENYTIIKDEYKRKGDSGAE